MAFGALQRRNAVFADHAAAHARLQADDKIRVALTACFTASASILAILASSFWAISPRY
jgi:hypothetical protein